MALSIPEKITLLKTYLGKVDDFSKLFGGEIQAVVERHKVKGVI